MKSRDAILGSVFVAGVAIFALGVGLVYLPAGLMVAGAASVASVVLYVRGTAGS